MEKCTQHSAADNTPLRCVLRLHNPFTDNRATEKGICKNLK